MDVHIDHTTARQRSSYDLPLREFRQAMRLVAPVIAGRYTAPPHVALRTTPAGAVFLQSRNEEMEIDVLIPTVETFAFTTPIQLPLALRRIVQPHIPGVTLRLTKTRPDNMLAQIDDIFNAELAIEPKPDYPNILGGWGQCCLRIDRETLLNTLSVVTHAIATQETRYYLNGVFIHPTPGDDTALSFVATDGHRLARRIVTGLTHNLAGGVILPREAVRALLKLLLIKPVQLGVADHVELCLKDTGAGWRAVSFAMATKLIDGTFPDYERVIPKELPSTVTFQAEALRSFCARIANFGRFGHACGVQLVMVSGAKSFLARWVSAEIGIFSTMIDAACDRDLSIGFQHHYLIHALNALKSETVTLHARGQSDPAIISSAGEFTDPSTTIVLMPMRI